MECTVPAKLAAGRSSNRGPLHGWRLLRRSRLVSCRQRCYGQSLRSSIRVRKAGCPGASIARSGISDVNHSLATRLLHLADFRTWFAQQGQSRARLGDIPLGHYQDHSDPKVKCPPIVRQIDVADVPQSFEDLRDGPGRNVHSGGQSEGKNPWEVVGDPAAGDVG